MSGHICWSANTVCNHQTGWMASNIFWFQCLFNALEQQSQAVEQFSVSKFSLDILGPKVSSLSEFFIPQLRLERVVAAFGHQTFVRGFSYSVLSHRISFIFFDIFDQQLQKRECKYSIQFLLLPATVGDWVLIHLRPMFTNARRSFPRNVPFWKGNVTLYVFSYFLLSSLTLSKPSSTIQGICVSYFKEWCYSVVNRGTRKKKRRERKEQSI